MNSIFCWSAICFNKVIPVGSKVIDEVLQHHHPLWVDVVEGDGEVTAAVHSLLLPVLDILNNDMRELN